MTVGEIVMTEKLIFLELHIRFLHTFSKKLPKNAKSDYN
jgi:hypothetical protein